MHVDETCDALIIGGGIAGCGIARDLALRGVSVVLTEKEDYGAGTTSASTRIVHGGVRYLENLELGLVREGLRERSILLKIAPNLVTPLRFIIPVYKDASPSRWRIKLGMTAYDLLSIGKSLPSHKFMNAEETKKRIPTLATEGLVGSYVYYDAQVSMVERLCLENVLAAEEKKCKAYNHCEIIRISSEGRQGKSATIRDNLTREEWTVTFRVLVNSTGPWVDEFLHNNSLEEDQPLLNTTKGVHLVCSKISDEAIVLYSAKDRRLFFVIPWMGYSLVGTTDTPYSGSPDKVRTEAEDLSYLKESLGQYFPKVHLETLATYAGLRPLVNARSPSDPSKISRKYAVIDSSKVNNLISVAGAKITEYRSASERAADLVCEKLSIRKKSGTRKTILEEIANPQDFSKYGKIPEDLREYLVSVYGQRTFQILDEISRDPDLQEKLCAHNPQIAAQVWFAAKHEHAKTVNDFMLRRTNMGYSMCKGLDALDKVTLIMKKQLNWTDDEEEIQKASYSSFISQRDRALSISEIQFGDVLPHD